MTDPKETQSVALFLDPIKMAQMGRFIKDVKSLPLELLRHIVQTLPKAQRTRGLSSYHTSSYTNLDQISISEI